MDRGWLVTKKEKMRVLLEKVKIAVTAAPEKYNQGSYCGSACCIAGWIHLIEKGPKAHAKALNRSVVDIACKSLGLTEGNFPWLFAADFSGCQSISKQYLEANGPKEEAAVACKAIDRYMKERGI